MSEIRPFFGSGSKSSKEIRDTNVKDRSFAIFLKKDIIDSEGGIEDYMKNIVPQTGFKLYANKKDIYGFNKGDVLHMIVSGNIRATMTVSQDCIKYMCENIQVFAKKIKLYKDGVKIKDILNNQYEWPLLTDEQEKKIQTKTNEKTIWNWPPEKKQSNNFSAKYATADRYFGNNSTESRVSEVSSNNGVIQQSNSTESRVSEVSSNNGVIQQSIVDKISNDNVCIDNTDDLTIKDMIKYILKHTEYDKCSHTELLLRVNEEYGFSTNNEDNFRERVTRVYNQFTPMKI